MDPVRFRWRVLAHLFASPVVSVPLVLGIASLALGLAVGRAAGFLGFMGLTGMLFGLGAAITRWVFAAEQLTQAAYEDLSSEKERTQYASLDQLEKRFHGDPDPRTGENLRKLRLLYGRLERVGTGSDASAEILPEIRQRAEELYASCLKSLERVWQQGVAAKEMVTADGRRQMLQARDQLLAEVSQSVDHLGATLDHLLVSALKRENEDVSPAAICAELERGLEVARRVEQRMDQFEQNLRTMGDATEEK